MEHLAGAHAYYLYSHVLARCGDELIGKLKERVAKSDNAELKRQLNWKVYKSAEPMQGNTLYIVLFDPAVSSAEYAFLDMLNKTLTDDEKRDPATREMFQKYIDAFAATNPISKLNLTPLGG